MPISGRFNTSSIALPMYMLAMKPQNSSGYLLIKSGPGWMPWIISAPMKSAMIALVGMPSESKGINDPAVAELLAASGPATPSITPVPNFSG